MAKWTESAKAEWKAYGQRLRKQLNGSEADAAEVEEDLKRHVDEEIHSAGLTVLDADQLKSILTRIGDLGDSNEDRADPKEVVALSSGNQTQSESGSKFKLGLLTFTAVLWPLVALIIEFSTRMCTAIIFDPVPSVWHGLVMFGIPAINLLALSRLNNSCSALPNWISLGVIFNLGVSLIYTILFIPLLPIGIITTIYFGLGLLPLTPLATCLSGFVIWAQCSDRIESSFMKRRLFWSGFSMAVCVLFLLEAPSFMTRVGLRWADSEEVSTNDRGIRWLRSFGNEEIMLKACYERPRRVFDVSSWFVLSSDKVTQEDARRIYYRVTGKPFNAVKPPSLYTRQGRWSMLDEEFTWDFDSALGGTAVAGRVRGLKMISSRMDSRVETSSATSYTEWTMEFENQASRAREARTQIQLPPGGVVSRLTLWVNGEEREAAFASREKTRKAYQKIAVERRRDPVLVTTSGPDQVLVQCFPVPADGGKMKIRFGITAPLDMLDLTNGRFRLPAMVERNFNLKPDLKHTVWIESRSALEADPTLFRQGSLKEGDFTLQGKLKDSELLTAKSTIQVVRPEEVTEVWTEAMEEDHVVIQRLIESKPETIQSTVVVVDGSVSMSAHFTEIREALSNLEKLENVRVIVASDLPAFMDSDRNPVVFNLSEVRSQLSTTTPIGGQDNLLALTSAWDVALEMGADTIWWIHGPQPSVFGDIASILQRMERSRGEIQLVSYAMESGPNRIMEAFDDLHASRAPKYEGLGATLERWANSPSAGEPAYEFARLHQRKDKVQGLETMPQVTRHIERLWAYEAVNHLRAKKRVDSAIQLASRHQLVTPVTGAVVLETIEQYNEMGLVPVPVETVPSIPEPGTVALLILGVLAFYLRWRLVRHRTQFQS